MTIPKVTIELPCAFLWEEIGHAQNPVKTETHYVYIFEKSHTITRSAVVEESNSEIKKQADKQSAGVEVGAAYEVVSAKISASNEHTSEVENAVSQIHKIDEKDEIKYSEKMEFKADVGGGDSQSIWQKMFRGPGVNVMTAVIYANPSKPTADQDCPISLELQGIRFLSGIDVVYADNDSPPNDSIVVVDNASGDINKGFGGKFVWLVPKWSYEVQDASSYVDVIIQDDHDDNFKDLAKGAKGNYRYLSAIKNVNNTKKIRDIQLLRQSYHSDPEDIKKRLGFDGRSRDINEGRHGDWLYLVYKTIDFENPIIQS